MTMSLIKILFIIWPFKMGFYRPQNEHNFSKKTHNWQEPCHWRYLYTPKCYYTCGHKHCSGHNFIHWITAMSMMNDKYFKPLLCTEIYSSICFKSKQRYLFLNTLYIWTKSCEIPYMLIVSVFSHFGYQRWIFTHSCKAFLI